MHHYFASCHHLLLPTAEGMNATVKTGVQQAVQPRAQQAMIVTTESVCGQAGCCYTDGELDDDAYVIKEAFRDPKQAGFAQRSSFLSPPMQLSLLNCSSVALKRVGFRMSLKTPLSTHASFPCSRYRTSWKICWLISQLSTKPFSYCSCCDCPAASTLRDLTGDRRAHRSRSEQSPRETTVPPTSPSPAAPRSSKSCRWKVSSFIHPGKETETCRVCTWTCPLLYLKTLAWLFKQGLPRTDINLGRLRSYGSLFYFFFFFWHSLTSSAFLWNFPRLPACVLNERFCFF